METLFIYKSTQGAVQEPGTAQELHHADPNHSNDCWISYWLSGEPRPAGDNSVALSNLGKTPEFGSTVSFIIAVLSTLITGFQTDYFSVAFAALPFNMTRTAIVVWPISSSHAEVVNVFNGPTAETRAGLVKHI
jgi:hypothetical protein